MRGVPPVSVARSPGKRKVVSRIWIAPTSWYALSATQRGASRLQLMHPAKANDRSWPKPALDTSLYCSSPPRQSVHQGSTLWGDAVAECAVAAPAAPTKANSRPVNRVIDPATRSLSWQRGAQHPAYETGGLSRQR